MKRILIFSLAYYPSYVSGAEAAIKEITDRIDPTDIAFSMITLRFSEKDSLQERIGNVTVYRVGNGSYVGKVLFPLAASFKARALHRKEHFDALWAIMTYMLLPVALTRILGVGIPHALTLQDGDPYEKVFGRTRIKPFLSLIDRGFRQAAVIQAISRYLATWPAKRGSKLPVELIRNGANPRDLKDSVSPAQVEELKHKLGKKTGDIWLVNTARLEYQKAQDDVIRALTMLPSRIKFLVVGGGSDEHMLKDLVRELGLENRVIFTGQVTREEVTAYRKASDIFVAPSRSEGLGNAFLSAMASRLPVVATQEGGLADFISDEVAWPVPKDDSKSIASAVERILADSDVTAEKVRRARAMVEQQYDWDVIAKQMRERVFAKVV